MVPRFAVPGKPPGLVAALEPGPYILRMDEKDVVALLGPPDELGRRQDRMRGRAWKCLTCTTVITSAEPIPIPAPCIVCGGIAFELVTAPLLQ